MSSRENTILKPANFTEPTGPATSNPPLMVVNFVFRFIHKAQNFIKIHKREGQIRFRNCCHDFFKNGQIEHTIVPFIPSQIFYAKLTASI